MHPGQKAAIAIVLVVVLLFGLLTGAAYFKKHAAGDVAAVAVGGASVPPPAVNAQPQPYVPNALPPQPAYTPPQQPVQARPPAQQGGWNAQNLTGTTWAVGTAYGNLIVTLNAGGTASASTPMGPVSGTWSASGNSLTVAAMGHSYTCRIRGWKIIAQDGIPITQL